MDETGTKDIDRPAPSRFAQAFARALELALAHEGATAPNPPVGCVLLDAAGTELAAGAHRRAGTAHAEAMAVATARQAGLVEHIHTAIVTREPCNHHGRTPPCSEALLATLAKQIWIACRDPNPKVGAGGMERLMAAGRRVSMLADLPHPDSLNLAEDERLWRSIKYEEVYLRAYDTVSDARTSIGKYLAFYNGRPPHSSLDRMTPDEAYFNALMPILAAA